MRLAAALIIVLGITGCASTTDSSREPLRLTVSAANYSQVSGEELYRRVYAPDNTHPVFPAVAAPAKPLFYAFVPVDYSKDVPLETIYSEIATPLAQRGYFNVIYQIKAGLVPTRIDYLMRIYCGRRQWKIPTVRTDKVTWGNDDLVYTWRGAASSATANTIGTSSLWDPRVGMTPSEIASIATDFQGSQGNTGAMGGMATMGGMGNAGSRLSHSEQQSADFQDLSRDAGSRIYYLMVVEAFRFEDVREKKNAAPCVWATFVAVPLRVGLELSNVIRPMAHASMPYFGTTTDGLQVYEVQPGKVVVGEPVEVPGTQKAPPQSGPASP